MTKACSSEWEPLAVSNGGCLPATPDGVMTLPEILQQAARQMTAKKLIYCDRHQNIITQSYSELLEQAASVLAGLRQLGLQPQDKVILLLDEQCALLTAFWGCILGGFVPIILETPPAMDGINPSLEKLKHLWKFLANPWLIIAQNRQDLSNYLLQSGISAQFAIFENCRHHPPARIYHQPHRQDLAFFALSSGSTGTPKCIQLTHRSVLARARGANVLNRHQPEDVILSWLPFDHIGSLADWHIRCVLLGCSAIYVQKEFILKRVLNWLDLIAQYRVTHSWAPTFAYALINEPLAQNLRQSWDLSCVEFLLCAGEIVAFPVMQDCLAKLMPYGLKATALRSAFGMAELGSGITYSPPDTALSVHSALPPHLEAIENKIPHKSLFTSLGVPIPGITLRIVNENHQVLPEGRIGYLQVQGEAVANGYYRQPSATQEAFLADGWFQTGDLGFLQQGHLVLTGRAKEMIIINGVNYYSHEIEAVVEQIEGVSVSYSAACGVRSNDRTAEQLAIFFNSELSDQQERLALLKTIREQVLSQVGISPDYLIPLAKTAIPKTSIGKIQYALLIKSWDAGEFELILAQLNRLLPSRQLESPAEIEAKIAQIWQTVLGQEIVNFQDNFFELGGNSLLLGQVQHCLTEEWGFQVAIADLFRYPSIAALTQFFASTPQVAPRRKPITEQREVAVIGMACRFPGANNLAEFWQNLCDGVESITFLSEREILAAGVDADLVKNPHYVKASPMIGDIENFDAAFWGYSAKEAELIDPQQRLMLECAWESLEDAGYNPFTYGGAIGLYAGAAMNTYVLNNLYPNRDRLDANDSLSVISLDSLGGFQMMVSNDKDYLTTRVSYKLNLTGPSINVQTACSTSAAAIHLACQSLLNGECEMAIAGGVSVKVPQTIGHLYQEGMILSPDGHCRAFDAQAQGTIFGSGVGLVVLKPLEAALKDGDRIYAVVKGSALNNDGGSKVSYFAPNGEGQARAVSDALFAAQVNAQSIGYVEAHGTATPLGDPIEIAGLTQAFRLDTSQIGYCAIGSVKTNVGHLQIASGVAGFIKTVLALYHQQLPASMHFEQPNPQIDFAHSPFYVNTHRQDWPSGVSPRRAGVNSLGIGGTNVHLILEEAPVTSPLDPNPLLSDRPRHLLTFSAKTEKALKALIGRYQTFFSTHQELNLADVAFTANSGRTALPYRCAIVAQAITQVQTNLETVSTTDGFYRLSRDRRPKIAFLFSGQGLQNLAIGSELYQTQPIFRKTLDACAEILHPYLDRSLIEILYPQAHNGNSKSLLASYTQPAFFAISYALFQLWKSWGIEPNAVMGDSVGEIVAACVAGVFSLEDALKLVVYQGRSRSSAARSQPILVKKWPNHHTVGFESIIAQITYNSPQLNLIASRTGDWATEAIATSDYWGEQMEYYGKADEGLKTLRQAGYEIFLDCSPQAAILTLGKSLITDENLLLLPSLSPNTSDWLVLLTSLKELYLSGVDVDWLGFDREYNRHRVSLPTYPFQRQRYWIDPPVTSPQPMSGHPLLGKRLVCPLKTVIFESLLTKNKQDWLREHQVNQVPVLAAAVYVEMALAAGIKVLKSSEIALQGVSFQQALPLSDSSTVQVIVTKDTQGATFEIYSTADPVSDRWTLHSAGQLLLNPSPASSNPLNLEQKQARLCEKMTAEAFYQQCQERGLTYGVSFKSLVQLWRQGGEALGEIRLAPDLVRELPAYYFHPRLLDACWQVVLATLPPGTYLPIAFERLILYRPVQSGLWSYAKLRSTAPSDTLTADLQIWDEQGQLVAQIEGLTSKCVSVPDSSTITEQDWLYEVEWRQKAQGATSTPNPHQWLILADQGGIGESLAALMQSNQQQCKLVFRENDLNFKQLLAELESDRFKGVIYLWSLDLTDALEKAITQVQLGDENARLDGSDLSNVLEKAIAQSCQPLLRLFQALTGQPRQLWLITKGTQAIANSYPSLSGITQSPLWGMKKAIEQEHPELSCVCLDLATHRTQEAAQILASEICHPDGETQIGWRGQQRYVARLVRSSVQLYQPCRLVTTAQKTLESLTWQPTPRRQPSDDEVEIEVRATGLNFRDVLNGLGMSVGDEQELGLECAGEVVAVGAGVEGLQVGDRVMGLAIGSFSQYVTIPAAWMITLPDTLSFEASATIPGAFLTAYYTLVHLAQLKPGDRVLIHAAAGGVGLAAVQLAQQIGAEVFATASASKWEFLQALGVKKVMNSRSLTFADEIAQMTPGIDVVLNCLSGEFMAKSLSVLRPHGCFLEIGKQGIWTAEQVAQVRPDIDYFCCDLLTVAQTKPDLIQSMLQTLMVQIRAGTLQPIPYQVFTHAKVKDAFRTLQQAKHIGKIVVSGRSNTLCRAEGSYLITGGFGDIGLRLAEWLAEKGAKHLILVGRNAPTLSSRHILQQLTAKGVNLLTLKADVTCFAEVAELFEQRSRSQFPPLRGIIHAAGVLADGRLRQQSWEQFEQVMAPKVQGAWNLHWLTQQEPLDFFVSFSSVASLLGSAGQVNYCAANAFLDSLAHARQGMAMPALSINWGAWGQIGMAAKSPALRQSISGMETIEPSQALMILEQLIASSVSQIGVVPINWTEYRSLTSPFLADLINNIARNPSEVHPAVTLPHWETVAPSLRKDYLIAHVLSQVAAVLGLNTFDALDPNQGFSELGIDSLGAIELSNRLQTSLNNSLPSTLTFDYPTVSQLANYLAEKLFAVGREETPSELVSVSEREAVQQLTEAEAEALLLYELENLQL